MAIIPNLRFSPKGTKAKVPKNYPYSDVLFDYAEFLRQADTAGSIAKNPRTDRKVVILGGGASAICIAYELLRAGAQIDAIIVPKDEEVELRSGRCFSYQFEGNEKFLAEMGSMRFPPSEVILFHYLQKFNIPYTDNFPDPGKVDTLLRAGGNSYLWKANEEVPALFKPLRDGWSALLENGVTLADGTKLVAPNAIATLLKATQTDRAKSAWQGWITAFESFSFRAAITLIFQQTNKDNIPNKVQWTDEQIDLFATLGVGSGGFGPLYSISFLEMMRLFVNELETDQQFIPGGIGSLFDAMKKADTGNGTVEDFIVYDEVYNIDLATPNRVHVRTSQGKTYNADAVIVTAQTWAAQISTNLTELSEESIIPHPILNAAIRSQHIIASSKSFMLTKDQFWKKNNLPSNIQSDTLVRGLYCLEYSDNPDDPGVVLMSYVWEDDSSKQIADFTRRGYPADASEKEIRIRRLVEDVKQIDAEFAKYLVPLDNDYEKNTVFIDWTNEQNYRGAFKLDHPGQSNKTQSIFLDYLKGGATETESRVFIAGDSASFYAGWAEGALQTGLNAATAVLKKFEASNFVTPNPLNGVVTDYNYKTQPR